LLDLNLDSYRFSLNWARLFPNGMDEPDPEAVERYDRFFEAMEARDIRPMVTLHHFVMPKWLTDNNNWETGQAVTDFRRFAAFAATRWGRYVDWWITVNEPEVYAFHGWARGIFPPGKVDPVLAFKVFTNLMRAHAEAYEIIKQVDTTDADGDGKPAEVGIANLIVPVEAASAFNPIEDIIVGSLGNFANVFWFEANETGIFDPKLPLVPGPFEEYPKFRNTLDFVGVNYYSRQVVSFSVFGLQIGAPPGAVLSELGIELYPQGLYESLEMVARYNLPVIITENGIADGDDNDRFRYIVSHLGEVARFMRDRPDVPVVGYVHWSLTDNYEWENGFEPRFGLYEIDYNTLERIKRPSAAQFAELIARTKNP
jgi:beta-glucosidase